MLYINNDNIREVKNDLRVAANQLLKWFEINIEKIFVSFLSVRTVHCDFINIVLTQYSSSRN